MTSGDRASTIEGGSGSVRGSRVPAMLAFQAGGMHRLYRIVVY